MAPRLHFHPFQLTMNNKQNCVGHTRLTQKILRYAWHHDGWVYASIASCCFCWSSLVRWSSSSNSSTIVKCSEPSAWGFFLSQRLISFIRELNDVKERNLTKQPPLDFQSCDFFSRCNSFLNLFSFNYFDLWPDRWGSFEIFPTSLSGCDYPLPATVALIAGY